MTGELATTWSTVLLAIDVLCEVGHSWREVNQQSKE